MFRNDFRSISDTPWFTEVPGSWVNALFEPTCALAVDVTRDGRDDLILCNPEGLPRFFRQKTNGFARLRTPDNSNLRNWRGAKVDDVNRDGLKDLVVTQTINGQHRLLIFSGTRKHPFFNFQKPFFSTRLPHEAPDLEILDVNKDRRKDIYVLQRSTDPKTYCGLTKSKGLNSR